MPWMSASVLTRIVPVAPPEASTFPLIVTVESWPAFESLPVHDSVNEPSKDRLARPKEPVNVTVPRSFGSHVSSRSYVTSSTRVAPPATSKLIGFPCAVVPA